MDKKTAIFIPTYKRPQKIAPLAKNIHDVTRGRFKIYFLVEKDDVETIAACEQADESFIINTGPSSYAGSINCAYAQTSESFFFCGADDLCFQGGWLDEALGEMKDPNTGIVGTHDPIHSFVDHSTHYLVRRTYIEQYSGCMDLRDMVLYPYRHAWTDQEIIGVCKARGMYTYCKKSIVEHHHPGWSQKGLVKKSSTLFDETYAKGNRHHNEDTKVFIKRSADWFHLYKKESAADKYLEQYIFLHNRPVLRTIIWSLDRFRDEYRTHIAPHIPDTIVTSLQALYDNFDKHLRSFARNSK